MQGVGPTKLSHTTWDRAIKNPAFSDHNRKETWQKADDDTWKLHRKLEQIFPLIQS
jgi:hypothetical protein